MWWFGETHFSAQADEFDRLFRAHLSNSYQAAGLDIPNALTSPIRRRPTTPAVLCPTGLIHPTIDGCEGSYYEWLFAVRIDLRQQYAALQRSTQCLDALTYGFDHIHYYVRLDVNTASLTQLSAWTIELAIATARVHISVPTRSRAEPARAAQPPSTPIRAILLAPPQHKEDHDGPTSTEIPCAYGRILELAIPRNLVDLPIGTPLTLTITLTDHGEVVERFPSDGALELLGSAKDLEAQVWPL